MISKVGKRGLKNSRSWKKRKKGKTIDYRAFFEENVPQSLEKCRATVETHEFAKLFRKI